MDGWIWPQHIYHRNALGDVTIDETIDENNHFSYFALMCLDSVGEWRKKRLNGTNSPKSQATVVFLELLREDVTRIHHKAKNTLRRRWLK